uniref:Xanthine dehydrogenase n=1 Tax=Agrobacterium vitis TaxID=373 RepID=A7XEG7_AGRVI|nr:xanthine dehydrogenase [Agrobacterium vitis]
MNLGFTLNGERVTVECQPETRLTEILRDMLHLTATKLACAIGRCGACSVLLDGRLANACLLMAWRIDGADILTAEGLAPHPLGQAVRAGLAEENAFQCGYCAPGFSLALVALFTDNPQAGEKDIRPVWRATLSLHRLSFDHQRGVERRLPHSRRTHHFRRLT